MPLAFTETLIQVARGALALLVAALAIYLSLRLLGKIAKFAITAILIALIVYFVFFATDIGETINNAVLSLPSLSPLWGKGA